MKIDALRIDNSICEMQRHNEAFADIKQMLESRLNLKSYSDNVRPVTINMSIVKRLCLLVGLSDKSERKLENADLQSITLTNTPYSTTFFTKANIIDVFSALLKLRYKDVDAEWNSKGFVSRVLAYEMLRGRDILMQEGVLDDWLQFTPTGSSASANDIPILNLCIGEYEGGMEATLDINSCAISNTQILVAGTTGSGKSNLLAVLLQQIRSASSDTHYPVKFLLFDYKGEFSDPTNAGWLSLFDTDAKAILDPMSQPLPFTPFKDFTNRPINEINLYSTTLAKALCAISEGARISANMDNRLSEAIINAYKTNSQKPVTFQMIFDEYNRLLPDNKREDMDSVKSVLSQLIRNKIFDEEDKVNLMDDCYIINLGRFEKEGVIAKAIVYFVTSKLNSIYEQLPKQANNGERVEIRHFTIIDEAHYMLGFENKPLQNLIAVGRNKGMSIILATQNMDSYKSKHFDFFANAQYPLIMKQQQQNDSVLKDLFGVNGAALQELKQAISGLQKGELIIKDTQAMELGLGGRHWKKIKVTHLI